MQLCYVNIKPFRETTIPVWSSQWPNVLPRNSNFSAINYSLFLNNIALCGLFAISWEIYAQRLQLLYEHFLFSFCFRMYPHFDAQEIEQWISRGCFAEINVRNKFKFKFILTLGSPKYLFCTTLPYVLKGTRIMML